MAALAPCLKGLVPLMQRAQIDYIRKPAEVNDLLFRFNDGGFSARWWHTPRDMLAAAPGIELSHGIVGNGANRTLGDFDIARSNILLSRLRPYLDIRANPDMKVEDVVTNRFIDPAIGLR